MKLTDTQRIVLSQAGQRDDRLAVPPERLPAAARQTVAKSLLKYGLVSDEHDSVYNARDAWQIDGRTRLLRISEAGLRAIGIAPEGEEEPEDTRPRDERNGVHPHLVDGDDETAEPATVRDTAPTGGEDAPPQAPPAANAEAALYPALPADVALLDQALATPHPARNATLREAAQRILDAWDDEEDQRYDLPSAIDALRAALATKPGRPAREPGAPRKPREGTKQETVLAMLHREEGATVAQICEATGWQQHTVRGFFAGLKKKGITVEVLERVRQVGPNKEGAKGSYTVYGTRD